MNKLCILRGSLLSLYNSEYILSQGELFIQTIDVDIPEDVNLNSQFGKIKILRVGDLFCGTGKKNIFICLKYSDSILSNNQLSNEDCLQTIKIAQNGDKVLVDSIIKQINNEQNNGLEFIDDTHAQQLLNINDLTNIYNKSNNQTIFDKKFIKVSVVENYLPNHSGVILNDNTVIDGGVFLSDDATDEKTGYWK